MAVFNIRKVCLGVFVLTLTFSMCDFEITKKKVGIKNFTITTTLQPMVVEDSNNTDVIMLDDWTLEESMREVCKFADIAPENCTCETLTNDLGMDGFCESFTAEPVTKYEGICLRSTTQLVETLSIAVISTLGIVGNILVLTVRVRNWKLSLHYQLISGLALADLAFCCIFLIIAVPSIWLCRWQFGAVLCSFLQTTLTLSSNIDLGFILIIAIERYIGIVHPFTGGVSACKIYLMICLNVVVGFLAALPFFFINKVDSDGACNEDWSQFPAGSSIVYGWISNIFFFLVPMFVTAILYSQSLRALKSTLFRQEMLAKLDETSRKKLISENKRILRVISTILVAFFFLIGPNHLAWFLHDNVTIPQAVSYRLFAVSSIAYALHTSINPIIYSIIDRKFRRNVYYLLRHGKRRKSYSTTVTALQCTQCTPVHQPASYFPEQNLLRNTNVEYIDNLC